MQNDDTVKLAKAIKVIVNDVRMINKGFIRISFSFDMDQLKELNGVIATSILVHSELLEKKL